MERALDIDTHNLLAFIRLQRRRVVLLKTRLIFMHTLSGAVDRSIFQLLSLPRIAGIYRGSFYLQIWCAFAPSHAFTRNPKHMFSWLSTICARMSAVLPISGVSDVSGSAETGFRRFSRLSSYREVQSKLEELQISCQWLYLLRPGTFSDCYLKMKSEAENSDSYRG